MENINSCEKIDLSEKQINYWKEVEKNINSELLDLKGTVLVMHNSVEFVDLLDFIKNLRKGEFTNVLYVSLVRSYNYMKNALSFNSVDDKRIVFIDCVSGYAFPIEENIDQALYHKPPESLDELKNILKFGIEKINPDIIILDSLSQYINFSRSDEEDLHGLCNFLNQLKSDENYSTLDSILLFYDSKMGFIKNLPKDYIDNIYKIEVF